MSALLEFRQDERTLGTAALWPLTGRTKELRVIASALRGSGVVLAGTSGVGRTRLAQEAMNLIRCRGVVSHWMAATASARMVPLGVFGALAAAEMPAAEPGPMTLRRIADALVTAANGRAVVIGVDDAHLLDDASAAVLHHLAQRPSVSLVVTVRSGEPAPDAVTALWKEGHLARIEVEPLSFVDATTLVESVVDGSVHEHSMRTLYRVAHGSVLFLRHLVDGLVAQGALVPTAGVWQLRGEAAAVTPQLADLLDAQIGELSPGLREVAETLAFGEPLEVGLLGRLVDAASIDEADQRGLITVAACDSGLEVRLAHPLYGEVLRGRAGVLRARRRRGKIARVLAEWAPRCPEIELRRAVLALDSNGSPEPRLLADAARTAAATFDFPLAERLARAGRDAGGGFDPHISLCAALTWQGRPREAETELARLESCASTDDEQIRAAVARAGNLFWGLGDLDGAVAVLDRVEPRIGDQACREELEAFRGLIDQSRASRVRAIRSACPASAGAREGTLLWSAMSRTAALGLGGRGDEIGELAARVPDGARGSFERSWHGSSLAAEEISALLLAGRPIEADRRAQVLAQDMSNAGHLAGAVRAVVAGTVALEQGRVHGAFRLLKEAAAVFALHDPGSGWQVRCGLPLVQASALLRNGPAARAAMASVEAARSPAVGYLEPQVVLARCWLSVSDGAVSEAIAIAREAARQAAALAQHAVEAAALHTAVRFGDTTAAPRLVELASFVHGELVAVAAQHAAALASGDGVMLTAVSARLEELGTRPAAADAAAQAAEAHERRHQRSRALAATARSRRLAQDCDGVRTPALSAADQPLPLTNREREIAGMVAAGLSNRAIAARLVVSVRTVEGHVYHACCKLGVGDRAELAALMNGTSSALVAC